MSPAGLSIDGRLVASRTHVRKAYARSLGTSVRIDHRWLGILGAALLVLLPVCAIGQHMASWLGLLVAGFVAWLLAVAARTRYRVTVGGDGIWLQRNVFPSRFVPIAGLVEARLDVGRVLLALRSGERIRLMSKGQAPAIVARIEEARVAFVQQHGTAGVEALVARGGRALDRWLRELRALATAREYREVRT